MKKSCLLMLDFINDIVHENGTYGREGYAKSVADRRVLENAASALEMARRSNIPVIHVIVGFSTGYPQYPGGSPVFRVARDEGRILLGSWATLPHEKVKPEANEPVITKHRISPFHGTSLDLTLRTLEVNSLMLAGVSTDMVILATARDGHDRDYDIQVLEDATAADSPEMHAAALTVIGRTARIVTVAEAFETVSAN